MRCDTCHGVGKVWSGPFLTPHGERAGMMIPCPDCGGCGVAHCCDGMQEQGGCDEENTDGL